MLISYELNIYSGFRFYSFKWCTFQLVWWCIFQLVYTEICRCRHIFAVFDFFVFNADSRAEGVEFQTILSASRLSDIFFMRLSVASVVFVSGA